MPQNAVLTAKNNTALAYVKLQSLVCEGINSYCSTQLVLSFTATDMKSTQLFSAAFIVDFLTWAIISNLSLRAQVRLGLWYS